jgi:hypothetical protein
MPRRVNDVDIVVVRNVIAQTLMEPICVMLKDERVTSRFPLVLLRDVRDVDDDDVYAYKSSQMTEILSESISQHNKNRAKVVSLIEPCANLTSCLDLGLTLRQARAHEYRL